MGISGEVAALLDEEKVKKDSVDVIRRFSGGGTVIVDEETLFISFIFEKKALPITSFPEPILRWSAALYTESWQIEGFHLIENDYAIGAHKCGGNAQYIQKDRWIHHTSFLWDYKEENMAYLRLPSKRPVYRADRPHREFLCKLKEQVESKEVLVNRLIQTLKGQFEVIPISSHEIEVSPHRKAVQRIVLESSPGSSLTSRGTP